MTIQRADGPSQSGPAKPGDPAVGPHAHIYTRVTPKDPEFFLTAWSNCTVCDQPPKSEAFDDGYATALRDVEEAIGKAVEWFTDAGVGPLLFRRRVLRAIASLRKPVTP